MILNKILLILGTFFVAFALCSDPDYQDEAVSSFDKIFSELNLDTIEQLEELYKLIWIKSPRGVQNERPDTKDVQKGVLRYLERLVNSLETFRHRGKVWDFHDICREYVIVPCQDFCRPLDPEIEWFASKGYDVREPSVAKKSHPLIQEIMSKWRFCDVIFSKRKFCDATHEFYWSGKFDEKDPMEFMSDLFKKLFEKQDNQTQVVETSN